MQNYSLLCIVKFNIAQTKREKRLARLPPGGRVAYYTSLAGRVMISLYTTIFYTD